MKARIPFAQRSVSPYSPLLIVLTIAAVCWGVQSPKTVQRRTPRLSGLRTIQLPEPASTNTTSLEKALADQQQATAAPSDQRLQFPDIGQLAWAAQGVQVPRAPSAAAAAANKQVPPLKVYFVLADGVYVYNPVEHSLQQVSNTDERQEMTTSVLGQPGRPVGGAQIVLVGTLRDFAVQYGPRARTAMLLQAGQAVQNIELEAVALGLTFVGAENINVNVARRILRLSKGLDPLYVIFVGYPASQTTAVTTEQPVAAPSGRKVLLVVPQQGYQDQELAETRRALELAGVPVVVASTRQGPLVGTFGGQVKADLLINQVNLSDYGAIVFIGGPGAIDYFNNPSVLSLARQATAQRKVVAAIGTAPTILANAGVLKGVRATGFLPEQERIQRGGATYTGNPVEKDGLTVTATGALAVPLFVQAIIEGLSQAG